MQKSTESRFRIAAKALIAFIPWVVSMYTLYWLEYGEVWTTATPHRGKLSVLILVIGMGLSLLTYSQLTSRKQ